MVCDALPPLPSSVVPERTMRDAEGPLTVGGNHDSSVYYPLLDRGTNGILLEPSAQVGSARNLTSKHKVNLLLRRSFIQNHKYMSNPQGELETRRDPVTKPKTQKTETRLSYKFEAQTSKKERLPLRPPD